MIVKLLNRLTVRASVQVFVALACFNAAVLGSMNFWQSARNAEITDRLLVDVELARAAGLADMMHDGLRASAYRALFMGPAGSDEDKQSVVSEATEFEKTFTDAVATVARNAHSDDLRLAVAQALPQVTRYAQTASAIVAAALNDPAAGKAALPGFSRDFDDLEKKLEAMSGLIKQQAGESLVERDAVRQRVLLATLAAVALTVTTTSSRPATRLPRSSASSTALPSRPTSWPSTRRSRRPARASRAGAFRWWRPRCAAWRSAAPRPRGRSRS